MVVWCVGEPRAGEEWGQKSEIEPLGLDFRRAVGNGDEYWWGEVVQWGG
jgi:hypothetical protein